MNKKLKVTLAVLSLAVLLPVGAFAASQLAEANGRDVMIVSMDTEPQTREAIGNYLKQTYGEEATSHIETAPDGTVIQGFMYPSYAASEQTHLVPEKTLQTRAVIDKIYKDGATEDLPRACDALFGWYFYTGPRLNACGPQGSEIPVSDLSTWGMDNQASSFMEGATSGAVDVYDGTNYTSFIETVNSDRGNFGSYLNDKASSADFRL